MLVCLNMKEIFDLIAAHTNLYFLPQILTRDNFQYNIHTLRNSNAPQVSAAFFVFSFQLSPGMLRSLMLTLPPISFVAVDTPCGWR